MHFDGNFRRLDDFDCGPLRVLVEAQGEEPWGLYDARQAKYRTHRHTQTIPLIFDEDFRHLCPTRRPLYAAFEDALRPVVRIVSGAFGYEGWIARCILTRLGAGEKIPPHRDDGYSLSHAHRVHVPVATNDAVRVTVGGETVHMRPGEIWEINNLRGHHVENGGTSDRVHLILDWAEPLTTQDLMDYATKQPPPGPPAHLLPGPASS